MSNYPRALKLPTVLNSNSVFSIPYYEDDDTCVAFVSVPFMIGGGSQVPPFRCAGSSVMQMTVDFGRNHAEISGSIGHNGEKEVQIHVELIHFHHDRWKKASTTCHGGEFKICKLIQINTLSHSSGYTFDALKYPRIEDGHNILLKVTVVSEQNSQPCMDESSILR